MRFFGNNLFYLNSKMPNISSRYTGSTFSDVIILTMISYDFGFPRWIISYKEENLKLGI